MGNKRGDMVKAAALLVSFAATIKSLWYGGSPFAGFTALWPTDADGKWSIQAEGIRLVFTNANGGAPTNLFINDTNGNEIDLILGLDNPKEYANYVGQLGGTIGASASVTGVRCTGLKQTSIQVEWPAT